MASFAQTWLCNMQRHYLGTSAVLLMLLWRLDELRNVSRQRMKLFEKSIPMTRANAPSSVI